MPSKVKSKKSQNKSKRALSTACWEQNNDGSLSLTIGSKKENLTDDTASVSNDSEQYSLSPHDQNRNDIVAEIEMKSPPIFTPTLPIQILKATWSECGSDYRMRQQTLRRKEMTAKYDFSFITFDGLNFFCLHL